MSTEERDAGQGDKLIWILGGVVALVGVAFYAFLNMGTEPTESTIAIEADDTAPASVAADVTADLAPADFSVQLNRARLAVDANMLTEPEGYSAWSIYSEILDSDAGNEEAAAGLELVANRLIDQALDALTTGRRNAAAEIGERVLSRFPDNDEAADIVAQARRVVVVADSPPETAPDLPDTPEPRAAQAPAVAPPAAPAPPPADPVVAIYSDFTVALANDSLRGAEDSAAQYLVQMRAAGPEHAMTLDAEQQLFDAIFARHNSAFDDLDHAGALQWLDTADELRLNPQRIESARDQLLDAMAVQAATESVSANSLIVRNYVAPVYPAGALRRGIEGWVDIAFVLSRDGNPMSVEVTDSSNSVFRNSATEAVSQWEFEPHSVHDRLVEQHAHTRIRFQLED